MHIGNRIKEVLGEKGRTAIWLASQIPCERSNVYHIFRREDINVKLLCRISAILGYNFLVELSEEMQNELDGKE
ncbi:hypothetical protein [Xylanibacter rodentium]|jgi:hypothetical protein|uniref:hypothetical protein n=1 Tax=Xylanibacter rodentium TaxID=2736289 RepID=UPI00256EEE3D|nr:hypothetical protein [Xylanibacter rodentium]